VLLRPGLRGDLISGNIIPEIDCLPFGAARPAGEQIARMGLPLFEALSPALN